MFKIHFTSNAPGVYIYYKSFNGPTDVNTSCKTTFKESNHVLAEQFEVAILSRSVHIAKLSQITP